MADIQITDNVGKPIDGVKPDLAHPSSLVKYLKSEALHLAVFPDFLKLKDSPLAQAAHQAITFKAHAAHTFQFGDVTPVVTIRPEVDAAIHANANAGSGLLDSDPFFETAKVPQGIGYVGIVFGGSLDTAVAGFGGDFSWGIDKNGAISLGFYKAFGLDANEPTLGGALAQTFSDFTTPNDISDLASLQTNDIATVSGSGSITVSGSVAVSIAPNPLASVNLPLNAGAVSVQAGAVAGLSASFSISGAYQVRTLRKDAATIELSVFKEKGKAFSVDFSATAGVTVTRNSDDLLPKILGAVSGKPEAAAELVAGLTPGEVGALTNAFHQGMSHSVQVSVNEALTALSDDQAAFQYEIQLERLDPAGAQAVRSALRGDFHLLTQMEDGVDEGGQIAPGIRMMNSVLTKTRKRGASLKLNLLGILNFISISELIQSSEILTDEATGDVTIKETVSGQRISAITAPMDRHEALRKAMFDSVLITTTYRAGRAIAPPSMACEQSHFALNQNTKAPILEDYLRWFVTLNLMTNVEKQAALNGFAGGGPSSCVLRTAFGDADCRALFSDGDTPRTLDYYLDIGRDAMRALLDPAHHPNDQFRARILEDPLWQKAVSIGANVNLGPLVNLSTSDMRVQLLIHDLVVITDWAKAMTDAGGLVRDLNAFVGDRDPAGLAKDETFQGKRDALQKKLAAVARTSKTSFDEPWGMVALFRAAGSPQTASARIVTKTVTIERRAPATIAAGH
jgi:hypothetical protein